MRCVARGLIAALLSVLLCLYVALTSSNVSSYDYDETQDETVRLLEGSDIPASTAEPQTSIASIVVVIVCLIIISVLVAGIIVVAMTLDPNIEECPSEDEEASFLYPESNSPPEKPSFFGLRGYDSMFDDEAREL